VPASEERKGRVRPVGQIIKGLVSGETIVQSIDMASLKSSIDRYDKFRRRLKNKEVILSGLQQQ
jgi:hypothetical protein